MWSKFKNQLPILFGDKSYHYIVDPNNPLERTFLESRFDYISKYSYNKNISQGECIMLNNLLVHKYKNTIYELLHFIYHTLDQRIISDENIFNIRYYKYGDFVNINNNKFIEVKTYTNLSDITIDYVINQYNKNTCNGNFIFSIKI